MANPSRPWLDRPHNLPILAGVTAAVGLAVPTFAWWARADASCSALGRGPSLGIVTLGEAIAFAALPVGLWLMVSGHRLRWLALPVGLVGLSTVAVAVTHLGRVGPCEYDGITTSTIGTITLLGGFGLLGLAFTLVRQRPQ